MDLSMLPKTHTQIIQPLWSDHADYSTQGFDCSPEASGTDQVWKAAIVCLPRAKALAHELIALALSRTVGPVIIDGDKTDGIESIYRDLRKSGAVSEAISKAHGKIFWLESDTSIAAPWPKPNLVTVDGFQTRPGVFSADGIDPGSALLVSCLPAKLGRSVVDLGAGWGFLSAHALHDSEEVETLDLVEADYRALSCAKANITDHRARFHWADALSWETQNRVDCVIMNPPFHQGRKTDTELGRGFIMSAKRLLTSSGQLFMVANRHLPYEKTLSDAFGQVQEIGGDNRFKVLQAGKPRVSKHRA